MTTNMRRGREGQPGKLLVVGGGIGGMTFAIRAAQNGMEVELIEADSGWRVYGAGISITGPTYRALKRLGLLDAVKARGFFIEHGAVICAPDGTIVSEVPMHALEPGLPTAGGIMRPDLHEIFSSRVRQLGIRVNLGLKPETIEDTKDGVILRLSDGTALAGQAAIIADGAFSTTRKMLFPSAPEPQYTGQYCWRTVADRPSIVDRPYFFMDGRVTCGLMPVSQTQMYMWLLEPSAERRWLDESNLANGFRALISPFGGPVGAVRQALDRGATIIARPLDALLLPLPWHRGRTILIGDAAHATTPQLASGAGIAVEDGFVLADMLAEHGVSESTFSRFETRRWERCRLVVEDSVAIGQMQQTNASPAALSERMRRAQASLALDV